MNEYQPSYVTLGHVCTFVHKVCTALWQDDVALMAVLGDDFDYIYADDDVAVFMLSISVLRESLCVPVASSS